MEAKEFNEDYLKGLSIKEALTILWWYYFNKSTFKTFCHGVEIGKWPKFAFEDAKTPK